MQFKRGLPILVLLLSTKFVIAQNPCLENNLGSVYGLSDSLLKIWRQDKFGCQQKRIKIIDSLFKEDKIIGIPKRAFLIMFGNPDEVSPDGTIIYKNVKKCNSNGIPSSDTISLDMGVIFNKEKVLIFRTIFVD